MADALIWGASGGMGSALTNLLIDNGWRVFAAARDESSIPEGAYKTYEFDSADLHSITDIVVDLSMETAGIDLWAYTAGELQADLLHKMAPSAWNDVFHSNLTGAFLTTAQSLHLINNDGQAAYIGAYIDHLILPKMGAYAAAKAGLETLVSVFQKENRKINFTLVKPGAVATPFWENAPFKMPKDAKQPEIVAEALLERYSQGTRGLLEL